jgi:hypothetical protein
MITSFQPSNASRMHYLTVFTPQHGKLIKSLCRSRLTPTAFPKEAQQANSLTKNVRRNAEELHAAL